MPETLAPPPVEVVALPPMVEAFSVVPPSKELETRIETRGLDRILTDGGTIAGLAGIEIEPVLDDVKTPALFPSSQSLKSLLEDPDSHLAPSQFIVIEGSSHEPADGVINTSTPTNELTQDELKQKYITDTLGANKVWWEHRRFGAADQPLSRAKTVQVEGNAQEGAGALDILEFLPEAEQLSPSEMSAVVKTIEFIDQMSGGGVFVDPSSRRLIFGSDSQLKTDTSDVYGAAGSSGVEINMNKIRTEAAKFGDVPEHILAQVLVHEILGHQMEQFVENGQTGKQFERAFDYSTEKVDSIVHKDLHANITPKASDAPATAPGNVYGSKDAAEDLAVTAEGTTQVMTGTSEMNNPNLQVNRDTYREELLLKFLNEVAAKAQSDALDGQGVGTPLKYEVDKNGKAVGVESARPVTTTEIVPIAYMKKEVTKLLEKGNKETFVYKKKSSRG